MAMCQPAKRSRCGTSFGATDPPSNLQVPPAAVAGGPRFRSLPTLVADPDSGGNVRARSWSPLTGKAFTHWRAQELQEAAAHLPAARASDEIQASVQQHPVTVIEGSTGTGKSTQVIQTVLEMQWYRQVPWGIVVQVCPIIEPLRDLHQRLEEEMDAWHQIHLSCPRQAPW